MLLLSTVHFTSHFGSAIECVQIIYKGLYCIDTYSGRSACFSSLYDLTGWLRDERRATVLCTYNPVHITHRHTQTQRLVTSSLHRQLTVPRVVGPWG